MPNRVPCKNLDLEHVYGEDHPLIGIPCLFEGKPTIPYGCYTRQDTAIFEDDDGVRLVILYYAPGEISEGKDVFVKALADIRPDDPRLIALNPNDHRYRKVFHMILAWLSGNRCGTYRCLQRHQKAA